MLSLVNAHQAPIEVATRAATKRTLTDAWLRCALCAAALGVNLVATAQGLDAFEPGLLRDPLRVTPLEMQKGSTLPGDDAPIVCSTSHDPSAELALETAVDLALCGNPRVQAAWALIKIRAAAMGEARAAYLPTIKASIGYQRDDDWSLVAGSHESHLAGSHANATLTWRLFDFGGREADTVAAKSGLDAALATHNATLQTTLVNVIQAYFAAQTAHAALVAKEQDVSIANSTLQTARRKQSGGGETSDGDVLQAETRLARATLDRSRATGDFNKVQAAMVYLIGAAPGTQLKLAALGPPRVGELNRSLAEWIAEARARHPSINAARAQVIAARARAQGVRSEGLPSVDFAAAFYQNGRPSQGLRDRTRERTVGITVHIPIFEGFAPSYRALGAEALIEQREAELRDTELHVAMEVVEAYSEAIAALKNLDASGALLAAARASLDSAQRKYANGRIDVLETLSSQRALAEAQEERIRCLSEWRSASLRIVAAAGQLGRNELRR